MGIKGFDALAVPLDSGADNRPIPEENMVVQIPEDFFEHVAKIEQQIRDSGEKRAYAQVQYASREFTRTSFFIRRMKFRYFYKFLRRVQVPETRVYFQSVRDQIDAYLQEDCLKNWPWVIDDGRAFQSVATGLETSAQRADRYNCYRTTIDHQVKEFARDCVSSYLVMSSYKRLFHWAQEVHNALR